MCKSEQTKIELSKEIKKKISFVKPYIKTTPPIPPNY